MYVVFLLTDVYFVPDIFPDDKNIRYDKKHDCKELCESNTYNMDSGVLLILLMGLLSDTNLSS